MTKALLEQIFNEEDKNNLSELLNQLNYEQLNPLQMNYLLNDVLVKGHLDLLKTLVEKGVDINARNFAYQTVATSAVLMGDVSVVEELVCLGADLYTLDQKGQNLLYAYLFKSPPLESDEMVRYLIDKGLNPHNAPSYKKVSRFMFGNRGTVELQEILEMSPYDSPTDSYFELIKVGDYKNALTTVIRILNQLGPIQLDVEIPYFIIRTLNDYRILLDINGEKEKAAGIRDFLLQKIPMDSVPDRDIAYSLCIESLFSQDKTMFRKLNSIVKQRTANHNFKVDNHSLEYMFGMISEDEGIKEKALGKLQVLDNDGLAFYMSLAAQLFYNGENTDVLEGIILSGSPVDLLHMRLVNIYSIYLLSQNRFEDLEFMSTKLFRDDITKRSTFMADFYLNFKINQYAKELRNTELRPAI